jgi:tetratricopeptide (TPR) repeat protein
MGIKLPDDRKLFRPRSSNNAIRIYFLLFFIVIFAFIYREVLAGEIHKPFMPTPTLTRTANSFAAEGETNFQAGKLDAAISSYLDATRLEPNNSEIWSELARIQAYSSNLLTTDAEKTARLQEAVASAEQAVAVNPEDSTAFAIQAFVYDWYSYPLYSGEESAAYLLKAENAIAKALQLDSQNALAIAFRAEIFLDQLRYNEALDYARRAVELNPNLMDVHRIYGLVMESLGNSYEEAIESYKKAAEINPNLTFLYISIGVNYRQLKQTDLALEYFAKAVKINEQNDIKDPIPYLAIANTYVNIGESFSASRNVMKAVEFTPGNANVYAQLGLIYFKARNYESSIPALDCALNGCTALQSCIVRQECSEDSALESVPDYVITGLPLSDSTLVYYYTYGSVLSAMHRKGDEQCVEAMRIFDIIKQKYADDAITMSIVNSGEAVCNEVD